MKTSQVNFHLLSLIFLIGFTLGLFKTVHSAPIPLTSSSIFISGKNGLFQSPLGFSLHLGQTDWIQVPKPANNSYIETVYRSGHDQNIQAALTVRVDKLKSNTDLDSYSQKWMKDYPRFGFNVLTAKKVRVGDEAGFMLDLVNRDNTKQLRQILFLKNRAAVTLTCRDDVKNFSKTLKSCNEIIRTFHW
jgi:hypothetical protein